MRAAGSGKSARAGARCRPSPTTAGSHERSSRWLDTDNVHKGSDARYRAIADWIVRWTDSNKRRYLTVAVLFLAPIVLTWVLLPPLDYLPPVKRDAIDGFIQPPPGTNIDTLEREFVQPVAERLAPYMAGEKQPALKNYYVLVGPFGANIGVRPLDPDHIDELNTLINEHVLTGFPDVQSFASQGNLFGGFGDGRNIDFQLQATNFEQLLAAARSAEKLIQERMPGAQVQAFQGLEMAEPELRLNPDDRRLNEVGWTRGDIGTVVRALGDGMFVGEYFDGERRLDMILRASQWDTPEQLASTHVATPVGSVLPLGELVQVESTVGAGGLRRVDGHRQMRLNFAIAFCSDLNSRMNGYMPRSRSSMAWACLRTSAARSCGTTTTPSSSATMMSPGRTVTPAHSTGTFLATVA